MIGQNTKKKLNWDKRDLTPFSNSAPPTPIFRPKKFIPAVQSPDPNWNQLDSSGPIMPIWRPPSSSCLPGVKWIWWIIFLGHHLKNIVCVGKKYKCRMLSDEQFLRGQNVCFCLKKKSCWVAPISLNGTNNLGRFFLLRSRKSKHFLDRGKVWENVEESGQQIHDKKNST